MPSLLLINLSTLTLEHPCVIARPVTNKTHLPRLPLPKDQLHDCPFRPSKKLGILMLQAWQLTCLVIPEQRTSPQDLPKGPHALFRGIGSLPVEVNVLPLVVFFVQLSSSFLCKILDAKCFVGFVINSAGWTEENLCHIKWKFHQGYLSWFAGQGTYFQAT